MLSLFKKDVKIVWLAANPKDTHVLKLTKELRAIEEVIRPYNRYFELKPILETRSKDFLQAILAEHPTILHFSGHATTEGICLQDDNDLVQLVAGKDLATILSDCSNLQCVILNACYSEAQALPIAQAIPFVIGMQDKLRDESGINFSFGFYSALVAGKSIEKAYDYGVAAMNMENTKQFSMQRTLIIQAKENTFDKAVLLKNLSFKQVKLRLARWISGLLLGIVLALGGVYTYSEYIKPIFQPVPEETDSIPEFITLHGEVMEANLKEIIYIKDAEVKFPDLHLTDPIITNYRGYFNVRYKNTEKYRNDELVNIKVTHPHYQTWTDALSIDQYLKIALKPKP